MALIQMFINVAANTLVAGPSTQQTVQASNLPFFCPDTPTLQIYLMTPNPTINTASPFTPIPTAGITFFFYIDDGTLSGTIYTQQISFSPGTDSTNLPYFSANLALNTASIIAAIGSLTTGLNCWIKAGYVQGGLQTTVLSQAISIRVGMPTGSISPAPPGQTTLTLEQARQLFVPQVPIPNQPIYIQSTAGKTIALEAVDNADGTASFVAAPIN